MAYRAAYLTAKTGVRVPRVMKTGAVPNGAVLDVDARLRISRGPHADPRLRADSDAAMAAFAKRGRGSEGRSLLSNSGNGTNLLARPVGRE
jgi:hypothetical protein